jgi:hypothetical protein
MRDIAQEQTFSLFNRRSVTRDDAAHSFLYESGEGHEIVRHVSFGRIDHDGALTRDEVARHQPTPHDISKCKVTSRMARRVDDFDVEPSRRLDIPCIELTVDRESPHQTVAGSTMGTDRNVQRLPQRLDPTHVVGVVMSEPNCLHLQVSIFNDLKKTILLLGVRARRIDNNDLTVAEQNTVGVGRRG